MRRFITSIIVLILCFLASYKRLDISGCHGMAEGLLEAFIYFLTLLFLIILLILEIYQKVKFRKSVNIYPFITFGLSISVIALVLVFQSDRFKSDKFLRATNDNQDLVLRVDNSYELKHKQTEQSCLEIGTYKVSNDTIYLKEEPRFDMTTFINEKYLIDSDNQILVPIYRDSLREDLFLRLENNYAP